MFRTNLKIWLAVLAVGVAFEMAKRWQWPAKEANLSPDFVSGSAGLPYSATLSHDSLSASGGSRRKFQHRKLDPTQSLSKALMIPPKSGSFDSNAGLAKAPAAKDKAVSQDHKGQAVAQEKKCRPRPGSVAAEATQVIPAVLIPQEALLSGQPNSEKTEELSAEQKAANENRKNSAEQLGLADKNENKASKEEELPFCSEEPTPVAADEQGPKSDHEVDSGAKPIVVTGAAAAANTQNPNGAAGGAANTNAVLESWKRRLLGEPNLAETIKLIEAMQSGQINPGDFYTLLDLMMKDPRDGMKELAVLAAGRTPSLQSFQVLTTVLKREPFGSALRKKAESEINFYEQPQFLPVLAEVMRSSEDVFAVVWATRQLDDSAHKYLTAKYNRPNPKNPSQMINPYVQLFNRFLVVLREMAATPVQSEESLQAKQTLSTIQGLIRALG